MLKKDKTLFLIWENPRSHQVILPLIKKFSKISKVYLISQTNKKIDSLDKKDSNYSKFCTINEVYYFKNFKFLNKFCLTYYYLISFFLTLFLRPKYIYIINKYPLLIVLLINFFFKTKIIYHNLDYDPHERGIFQKLLNKIQSYAVRFIDILIFSHEQRAQRFLKDTRNNKRFITFYNSLPLDYYNKYKKKKNSKNRKKNIFYFGSIGPGHGLLQLIKSFKFLDENYNLFIYGWIVDKNFFSKIKVIIESYNLKKRVIIKNNVKDYMWKSKMIESHLGIALYEDSNLSHKYMFPASQKINACLAAGIPILVSNSKDMIKFKYKYKCCVATSLDAKIIAKNINLIIKNKNTYNYLKKNSLKAFKNTFNFENQFRKLKI
jgi:glycosyltransferase involved in cell wall biosynthesis